jgi:hypothetical protein
MNKEKLAEQLHIWYLEAITSGVAGEQYNCNAVKEYKDLSEEQKNIDRYIAEAIIKLFKERMLELIGDNKPIVNHYDDGDNGFDTGYNFAKKELRKKVGER